MTSVLRDDPAAGVARLRLHRPARHNSVDHALLDDLTAGLTGLAETGARALVLGSTTPAAFCAGVDLDLDDGERAAVSDRLYALYRRLVDLPIPIVAAVEGHAVGAGAQFALTADLRVAGPNMGLRVAGIGHGLLVGAWALPSLVGRGRTVDVAGRAQALDAASAEACGLVEFVAEDAPEAAVRLAGELAAQDAATMADLVATAREGLAERLETERARNAAWTGRAADPRGVEQRP